MLFSFSINIIFPFQIIWPQLHLDTPNQVLHLDMNPSPRLKLLFQIQWHKLHFGPHFCRRRLRACTAPTLYRLRTGTGTGILLLDDLRWWWCKMVRWWVLVEKRVQATEIENTFTCITTMIPGLKCVERLGQTEMLSELYISRFSVPLVNYRKLHTWHSIYSNVCVCI